MTKGVAMRAYTPPQRAEGESKRHYLAVLDGLIETFRKIKDEDRNTREKRSAARRKHTACVKQRNNFILGRD